MSESHSIRLCAFEGCGRRRWAQNLCSAHCRQLRDGEPLAPLKPASECSKCSMPAEKFRAHRKVCSMHNRFDTMQNCARFKGKEVPTWGRLEVMASALFMDGMKCFYCRVEMVWAGRRGQNNVVSLQHDRDGTIRFLCLLCNNRHDDFPGDTFYQAPVGHFFCPRCERVLPPECFYRRRSDGKRKSYCKECRRTEWATRKGKIT